MRDKPLKNTNASLGSNLARRDASNDSIEDMARKALLRVYQAVGPGTASFECQKTRIDDHIENTRERIIDYSAVNLSDFDGWQSVSDQVSARYEFSLSKIFSRGYEFNELSDENHHESVLRAKLSLRS